MIKHFLKSMSKEDKQKIMKEFMESMTEEEKKEMMRLLMPIMMKDMGDLNQSDCKEIMMEMTPEARDKCRNMMASCLKILKEM